MSSSYYGLVLLVTVVIGSVLSVTLDDEFDMFKLKFGKFYQSADEESSHRAIFMQNKEYIDRHNANPAHSYWLKINQFSDIDPAEFVRIRNRHIGFARKNKQDNPIYQPNITMADLPTSLDWRDKNIVTAVKDQGQCGSCWAFSTTGSLESQHALKTSRLVSLSEQQLIDCSSENSGCRGGTQEAAFDYIKENGGIDTEQSYPYQASNGATCFYDKTEVGATCSGYVLVNAYNCDDLKKAVVTVGPISVSMDASDESFQSYSSGIYNPTTCNSNAMQLDHAVLVVGYGSENGMDYWLVKNSWGTTWGKDGYFKIASADNTCGICTDGMYPVIEKPCVDDAGVCMLV